MIEEIDMDIQSDKIYRSSYLTQSGQGDFPDLIRKAADTGNDDTLAASLRGKFNLKTQRKRPKAPGYYTADVPVNAAEVLAQSEFNRYFVRGLCRRAIATKVQRLQVFRAKAVTNPRIGSESKIGLLVDPEVVLIDVRRSQEYGVDTALGLPPGPGSGITLRIKKS